VSSRHRDRVLCGCWANPAQGAMTRGLPDPPRQLSFGIHDGDEPFWDSHCKDWKRQTGGDFPSKAASRRRRIDFLTESGFQPDAVDRPGETKH